MARQRSATIVFVAVVALTGCNATTPPVSQQTAAPASDTALTPAVPRAKTAHSIASALPNADYVIEVTSNGKATLKDGLYEEAIPDSTSKNVVRLGPEPAFGDLDGDRAEDAAVTLLASSGGSGSFTYLAPVLSKNGTVKPLASILLGDRITMKSMQIVDGQIKVTWLDRTPGEPMSTAPAAEISKAFVVQHGKMVAVGSPDSEQLRGHYTWGAEVETFQPCGSKQSFWVVGDKALLQTLRDKAAELSRTRGKPYQPIYIEASGVFEGKATDGFAMDYDAVYRFKAVQAVNDASPADCKAGG
ncbi:MAG TPA: hypothetical protein VJ484_11235 [Lysobacter sp.]|nr:hypothetical protein [Lysobacter sp.]